MKDLFKLCLSITVCFTILKCQKPKDAENNTSSIFKEWTKSIEPEKLNEFKNAELDSTGKIINIIQEDVKKILDTAHINLGLNYFRDTINKSKVSKSIYSIIAFHYYLNNQNISLSELRNKFSIIDHYKIRKYEEELFHNRKKLEKINFEKFQNGDTINICLPIEIVSGKKLLYYYGLKTPNNFNCEDYEALDLIGTVIDKRYHNEYLFFSIHVLSISETGVITTIGTEDYIEINDTTEINITLYGREIK